ncbi:c-type cytochrome [Sunxiuqinia sp. sy24]|uniref:c-type cytochrome n=1 Tax=Sunxiuqinia sp. sy24 TaxID=3461495 RepID=UPI0040462038
MRIIRLVTVCIYLFNSILLQAQNDQHPFSPTDMATDINGKFIAVAGKTANSVLVIRLKDGKVVKTINTDLAPTGVIFKDEALWISKTYSKGYLQKVDLRNDETISIKVGHGACSPIAHPIKDIIYVANQFSNDISVVDINQLREIRRIKVLRQPTAQTISPDGKYLFVANLLPETRADIDTVASCVSVIDTKTAEKIKDIRLANGSNALRDIQVSPDGRYVFISHNLGRFQVPTTQLVQGWMNTSAVSVIDARALTYVATVILDQPEQGAAGSWGIDINSKEMVVAHSGTHDYSRIAYQAFINKLVSHPDKQQLTYDLNFIQNVRNRYPVKGNGPRSVLMTEKQLFIANYFSDNIEIIDLDKSRNANEVIALNKGYQPDEVRLGEMIFNDASHCFQGWQSCNGCHPNDARTDGLNWDLLNDGIGNPKNCKSLLVSHHTPPAMITGIRPNAEVAVRAGFKHIQFVEVTEDDARKVDAYLKSLKAVPSPFLNDDGELSANALKGKTVFEKANCTFCHHGTYHTDLKRHEIGQQGEFDRQNTWDTPTLIEIWRTAPYLHDGRSATLKDVFINEKHGLKYHKLSEEEIDQLVEYLNSL